MKTETENLRELDDWIAINVMDLKFNGHHWVLASDENLCAKLGGHCPEYTTDSAAAMQVLEKCAEKEGKENFDGVQIDKIESGWIVSTCKIDAGAETLPLAICKFAKALYSK